MNFKIGDKVKYVGVFFNVTSDNIGTVIDIDYRENCSISAYKVKFCRSTVWMPIDELEKLPSGLQRVLDAHV